MKVVLLRDVARIGRRYEIKEVPSGHALNYLIPKKLAQIATPENLKRVNELKEKQAQGMEMTEQAFEASVEKLAKDPLVVTVTANEQGHLFKGVKAEDIVAAAHATGVEIDASYIDLPHPIKTLGEHQIKLVLGKKHGAFMLNITSK